MQFTACFFAVVGIAAAILSSSVVEASTSNSWIGGVGLWSNASLWSSGTVPSQNDDVKIVGSTTHETTVYVDVSEVTIASLTVSQIAPRSGLATLILAGSNNATMIAGATYLFNVIGSVTNTGAIRDVASASSSSQVTVELNIGTNYQSTWSGSVLSLLSSNTVVNVQAGQFNVDQGSVLKWSAGTINTMSVWIMNGAILTGGESVSSKAVYSTVQGAIQVQSGMVFQWNATFHSTINFAVTTGAYMTDCPISTNPFPIYGPMPPLSTPLCWLSLVWALATPTEQHIDGGLTVASNAQVIISGTNQPYALFSVPQWLQFNTNTMLTIQANSSTPGPVVPPVVHLVVGGVKTCNASITGQQLTLNGLWQTVDVGSAASTTTPPAGTLVIIPRCTAMIPPQFQTNQLNLEIHRPLIPLATSGNPMISWNSDNWAPNSLVIRDGLVVVNQMNTTFGLGFLKLQGATLIVQAATSPASPLCTELTTSNGVLFPDQRSSLLTTLVGAPQGLFISAFWGVSALDMNVAGAGITIVSGGTLSANIQNGATDQTTITTKTILVVGGNLLWDDPASTLFLNVGTASSPTCCGVIINTPGGNPPIPASGQQSANVVINGDLTIGGVNGAWKMTAVNDVNVFSLTLSGNLYVATYFGVLVDRPLQSLDTSALVTVSISGSATFAVGSEFSIAMSTAKRDTLSWAGPSVINVDGTLVLASGTFQLASGVRLNCLSSSSVLIADAFSKAPSAQGETVGLLTGGPGTVIELNQGALLQIMNADPQTAQAPTTPVVTLINGGSLVMHYGSQIMFQPCQYAVQPVPYSKFITSTVMINTTAQTSGQQSAPKLGYTPIPAYVGLPITLTPMVWSNILSVGDGSAGPAPAQLIAQVGPYNMAQVSIVAVVNGGVASATAVSEQLGKAVNGSLVLSISAVLPSTGGNGVPTAPATAMPTAAPATVVPTAAPATAPATVVPTAAPATAPATVNPTAMPTAPATVVPTGMPATTSSGGAAPISSGGEPDYSTGGHESGSSTGGTGPTPGPSSGGLSGGAKAGIAIGVIFGAALIGFGIYRYRRHRRSKHALLDSEYHNVNP